jgi:zinc protease
MKGFYSAEGVPERLVADDRYTRIGAADLERIARRYLVPANLRVLFLLPAGAEAGIPPPDLGPRGAEKGRFSPVGDVPRVPSDPETMADDLSPPPKDSDATLREIPGGPRFILLERDSVPLVGGAIVFPVGSSRDPAGKEGLAALTLEALEFSTEGRGRYELRWFMYENGSSFDVRASRDSCRVSFTVPRDGLPEMLRAVRDIVTRPAFSDEAIRTARGRLLRKVRSAAESVGRSTGAVFRRAVYGETPDAHEPDGTEASLARIERQDLVAFHAEHLRLENAVIALVGDLSPRSTNQLVTRLFAPRAADPAPPDTPMPATPAPAAARREFEHPSGRGYLLIGARGPALQDPDKVPTELLRMALGWRVFAEFTDVRSTAYEAGAIFSSYRTTGSFGVYVGTAPENLAEAEAVLLGILAETTKEGVPDDLREDAKGAWLGSAAIGSLRSAWVATRMATREATDRGYGSFEADSEEIRGMTGERLNAAASRLLEPDRFVTVVANPPR